MVIRGVGIPAFDGALDHLEHPGERAADRKAVLARAVARYGIGKLTMDHRHQSRQAFLVNEIGRALRHGVHSGRFVSLPGDDDEREFRLKFLHERQGRQRGADHGGGVDHVERQVGTFRAEGVGLSRDDRPQVFAAASPVSLRRAEAITTPATSAASTRSLERSPIPATA